MASITVQTPYNEYTGNGSSTVYAYTFLLLAAADLVVKIDGTTTTAYTLSGIGTSSGGNVTFTTAPASGATVLISREIPLSRSIEYQTNGDFRASTVNLDFNRLWQYLQLDNARRGGTLRLPYPEQVNEGPAKAARLGRMLAFNATTGQPKASDLTETQIASAVAAAYTGATGPLDALSFIQAGTGAVSRTAQDKARETISVLDFAANGVSGAAVDPTGVLDSSGGFQAALNYMNGRGGRIYVPTGTYKLNTSLNWPTQWPILMCGDGIEATHLNYTGSSDAINMRGPSGADQVVKSAIEDMRISGNGSTSVNGIDIAYAYSIELNNIRVYNFEVGVRIEQAWSIMGNFVHADSNSQNGIELHNEANNVTFYCGEFLDNANGVYTAGARAVLFSGCTLEANTAYGAYVTANSTDGQSENIVFHGCYIEGNQTAEIKVITDSGATNPQGVILRDCYFVCISGKATAGIRVDQANLVVIDGCDFSVGSATYAYSLYIADSGTVTQIRYGINRDTSTSGVYRGTGTSYSDEVKLEARAQGRFAISGGAIASVAGFGVASVTRISTGVYEVTLRDAMPGTDYTIVASAENGAAYVSMLCSPGQPISTTVFRIATATDPATLAEARTVNFAVFA